MGQGARTILSQLVSEHLGVPMDRVNLVMGDTAVVPFDYSTSASRSTVFMGNAVVDACDQAILELVPSSPPSYMGSTWRRGSLHAEVRWRWQGRCSRSVTSSAAGSARSPVRSS